MKIEMLKKITCCDCEGDVELRDCELIFKNGTKIIFTCCLECFLEREKELNK